MRRFGASRRVLGFGVAAAAAVVVLAVAGPAVASGTFTCPPDDGTDVQGGINGGGTVTINGTCHGNFDVTNNVTIQGGSPGATLDGDGNGPVLTIHGPITVTIKNLTITDGSADFGGGIDEFYDGGFPTVNVIASRIVDNVADVGGGVGVDAGTIVLTNSTVSMNAAFEGGGGLFVFEESVLNMTGTTVSRNQALGTGGGLWLLDDSIAAIDSSTFSQNQSFESGGGAIESFESSLQLTNSRLLFNTAAGYGGGIEFGEACCQFAARPNLAAAIKNASADGHGSKSLPPRVAKGAINRAPLVTSIPVGLTIANSTLDHNTTQFAGGGAVSNYTEESDTPATITNSVISNNRALGNQPGVSGGGGLEQDSGDTDTTASMVVTGSKIYGNTAANSVGGGIENIDDSFGNFGNAVLSIASTSFANPNSLQVGNTAIFGGGIYNAGLNASASLGAGTKLIRNKATANGGGVFNDCDASLFVSPGVVLLSNIPNNIVLNPGCVIGV